MLPIVGLKIWSVAVGNSFKTDIMRPMFLIHKPSKSELCATLHPDGKTIISKTKDCCRVCILMFPYGYPNGLWISKGYCFLITIRSWPSKHKVESKKVLQCCRDDGSHIRNTFLDLLVSCCPKTHIYIFWWLLLLQEHIKWQSQEGLFHLSK